MSKPTSTAWAAGDPASYTIEPGSGKKSVGWTSAEKPPYQYMNWIQYTEYLWQVYFENKTEAIAPTILVSTGTATWNGSTGDLVLSQPLDISFRVTTGEQINRIAAGTLTIADGSCLVMIKDKTNSSPVTLADGTYATLDDGQYDIVAESSLSAAQQEKELVIFRRRGTNLECALNGLIYPTGSTITFGQSITSATSLSGVVPVASGGTNISSYTVGDLLYASGATTLSKLADVAAGNVLISGGVGVAPSWGKVGLTTHVSGSLPAANGGTGATSATGTAGSVVLSGSPTITTPTFSGGWTGPGSSGQNTNGEILLPDADPPTIGGYANINSFVRAWGSNAASGGDFGTNYNSSVFTKNSTGNYTWTIDTDLSGNGKLIGVASGGGTNIFNLGVSGSSGSFDYTVTTPGGTPTDRVCNLAVVGK